MLCKIWKATLDKCIKAGPLVCPEPVYGQPLLKKHYFFYIQFLYYRSKIKLTTRELKLALKQATIMLEDFYPTHVLNRIIDQQGAAASELEVVHTSTVAVPRHVEILEKGSMITGTRRAGPTESKFATVEEWWDSKGLALGMMLT